MSLGSKYIFIPWFRQGISTRIAENIDTSEQRAKIYLDLSVVSYKDKRKRDSISLKSTPIELYGPGDVIGFDSRLIIRTDPKDKIGDFEPNYIPFIEFSTPDFPWRYTPTTTALDIQENKTRLQPWICLIVLKSEEGVAEFDYGDYDPKKQPAPFILIQKNDQGILPLPLLDEIWAWSHVQVTTAAAQELVTEDYIQALLNHSPGRIYSRLLCPRKLEPGIRYHAFVVPTFKTGVLAGLGYDQQISTTGLLEPAWDVNQDIVVLPYYYSWEFRTGQRGDFEYLVRLLEPNPLDKRVGTRFLSCANPGYRLPPVYVENPIGEDPHHGLRLEGALMALDAEPTPWENAPDEFQKEFTDLLNLSENLQETHLESDRPMIVPPIYGRWHAAAKKIDPSAPKWLSTLNLDPRFRAIAGLGTVVVQEHQERLMESAWKQIGAINEVNQILRQAQLACAGSERILDKHISSLTVDGIIEQTSPLQDHLTIETDIPPNNPGHNPGHKLKKTSLRQVSLRYLVSRSPIPPSILDSGFKRIKRPRGAIRKRQNPDIDPNRKGLMERLNTGEISSVAPIISSGVPNIEEISEGERPTWADGKIWQILKHLLKILNLLTIILFLFSIFVIIILIGWLKEPVPPLISIFSLSWVPLLFLTPILKYSTNYGRTLDLLKEENLISKYIDTSSVRSDFKITKPWILKSDETNVNHDIRNKNNELDTNSKNSTKNHKKRTNRNKNPRNNPKENSENNPGNDNSGNNNSDHNPGNENSENNLESNNPGEAEGNTSQDDSEDTSPIDSTVGDIELGDEFKEYAVTLSQEFLDIVPEEVPKEELDLSSIENVLLDTLDPNKTILEKIKTIIRYEEADLQLEPILAAPYFPEPMYDYLREMSQDLLFPGLEYVPQNTISLLKPNRRFIEAYMVGLSHEMARELIWREYPTDQRGTYFRRFWNYSEFIPPLRNLAELEDKAKEILLKEWEEKWENLSEHAQKLLIEKEVHSLSQSRLTDIKKIHRWYQTELGENASIQPDYLENQEEKLVLLIRSDLLKKYPRTFIYAVKGSWKENGERGGPQFDNPEMIKTPIFKGSLHPDVTFLGFDLTATEAKGKEQRETNEDSPGWYFIAEERVSETRFGMDISVEDSELPLLQSWNDLSWSHPREKGLIRPSDYLSLYNREKHTHEPQQSDLELMNSLNQKESVTPVWGLNSAHMARILGQKPFRVAIHADDMIPR